ncbi:hypothetical protein [Streptomyces sp. NBC_00847]|uniref:hypothetical protein n=1 Tax=Streptomyces sp. NBC_00847 TaxID=2975850 RepID=UPI002255589C|nr:hypothetical protein [Streptomyces sp. NBC_00847]MCX4883237.1 hypothetical protein [Streptomyces sp. NBC_00847]
MKRSSRVRVGATVAVSALSLALITGCGGDSGSGDAKDSAGKGSSPTAAAKALSAAELGRRIISEQDLDGYEVKSADKGGKFAESKDQVTVVDAKCEPLAYVLTGFAPGDESAYVNRMATEKVAEPTSKGTSEESLDDIEDSLKDIVGSTMTIVSLSSYDGGGAEQTMKSVGDAVAGCASGFTVSAKGQDTQKFTRVAEEKSSGSGDESVAFSVTGKTEGDTTTVHAEVVRHGSTVATYYSVSLAALAGKHDKYGIPAGIIKAQEAKLD